VRRRRAFGRAQHYAGDYYTIRAAFLGPHPLYGRSKWDVLIACLETLDAAHAAAAAASRLGGAAGTPHDAGGGAAAVPAAAPARTAHAVRWDELRKALARSGVDLPAPLVPCPRPRPRGL
jgi:hypothetical protein